MYSNNTPVKLETQKALQGHSKSTPGALGHKRHSGTPAVEALKILKGILSLKTLEGYLGTWALKVLGNSVTWALRYSGNRGTRGTLFGSSFFQTLFERFISLIYDEDINSENLCSPVEYML